MTDNEINIAIAKACGWWGIEQEGMMRPPLSTSEYEMVPDYCHDLNAMWQAEHRISLGLETEYGNALKCIVARDNEGDINQFTVLHATARQRAEAFLQVKGMWK